MQLRARTIVGYGEYNTVNTTLPSMGEYIYHITKNYYDYVKSCFYAIRKSFLSRTF